MTKPGASIAMRQHLLRLARAAAKNAHAPYSKFKVGAALLTENDQVMLGCNVESASYGLTICAERAAIFAAVARFGPRMRIRALAVVSGADAPCSPCGACRQLIYEFGPRAMVFFKRATGWKRLAIAELLPEGFRLR